MNKGTLTLKGMPGIPTVNARSGPGLNYRVVTRPQVGLGNLPVLDALPDAQSNRLDGKIYQWLKTSFPNGKEGWLRDDLVEIIGDLSDVGYGQVSHLVLAFTVPRSLRNDTTKTKRPPIFKLPEKPPERYEDYIERLRRIGELSGPTGMNCVAAITGIPSLDLVNVRSGAGASNTRLFTVPKGERGLLVLEAQSDSDEAAIGGKIHQWFRLSFNNGRTGWVRDDLLTIKGQCSAHGYDTDDQPTVAFSMTRETVRTIDEIIGNRTKDKPKPTTDCIGTVVSSIPAKMRQDASTGHPIIVAIDPGEKVGILGKKPQVGGGSFIWMQVTYGGKQGWMRRDTLSYEGKCEDYKVIVSKNDLYPVPIGGYTPTTPYQGSGGHMGWDLATNRSATIPVTSGPQGGTVVRALNCTLCSPGKPSVYDNGLTKRDLAIKVYTSRGWGWGFGNHIIIHYDHAQLPPSTQKQLAALNLKGANIFAVYAHLRELSVDEGDQLQPATKIGVVGNSGNSSGDHLHLELRAGNVSTFRSWSALALLDPAILFKHY